MREEVLFSFSLFNHLSNVCCMCKVNTDVGVSVHCGLGPMWLYNIFNHFKPAISRKAKTFPAQTSSPVFMFGITHKTSVLAHLQRVADAFDRRCLQPGSIWLIFHLPFTLCRHHKRIWQSSLCVCVCVCEREREWMSVKVSEDLSICMCIGVLLYHCISKVA